MARKLHEYVAFWKKVARYFVKSILKYLKLIQLLILAEQPNKVVAALSWMAHIVPIHLSSSRGFIRRYNVYAILKNIIPGVADT